MGGIQFEANQHSPPLLVLLLACLVLARLSTLPTSFAFSLHIFYPCRVLILLHTPSPFLYLPSLPDISSAPDPFTIYHSKSRTITSRVRNTGILESRTFPFTRYVLPVDILAYLPVFTTTRTTRLELVRALASLLMQLSD